MSVELSSIHQFGLYLGLVAFNGVLAAVLIHCDRKGIVDGVERYGYDVLTRVMVLATFGALIATIHPGTPSDTLALETHGVWPALFIASAATWTLQPALFGLLKVSYTTIDEHGGETA